MDLSKLLHGFVKFATWICQICYMDLLNIKVVTWICQSCYLDLSKLLLGFIKVVLCISSPFSVKTKVNFDQDFLACRSFCFELKVLNESK